MIGDRCDTNLCKTVEVNKDTKEIKYLDKCKNNSYCDITTGKCNVILNMKMI